MVIHERVRETVRFKENRKFWGYINNKIFLFFNEKGTLSDRLFIKYKFTKGVDTFDRVLKYIS